ncbi:LIM domain only protein 7-like [Periophthalmus magnuspinnatus]|uniref:LIM domain only protein 7-like n=1 Tax=Periophthalmus magnuspinnatus TaxID=409849 RepID=UPI002436B436|nr:LIM domain only protein 7-like [Periophthalmus magnuspinnatus]
MFGWLSLLSSRTGGYDCGQTHSPQRSVRVDHRSGVSSDSLFRDYDDSEDSDDEVGHADPVQDDLYTRKMGTKPQLPALSHDKFLPKFWTPEEDIHIQKIKLGSQKRPWYKKMQGLSYKKSGSSSDDSDCDISPWLSSGRSSSGPSQSLSDRASAAPPTLVVGKSSYIEPNSPSPQLPVIHSPVLEPPPLVFPPVDPTSGPKLVKCERWPLYGRQDPREPPDQLDYDSLYPDLENDDMFARRTLAFQSNTDLAMLKLPVRPPRYSSEPQLNIVTRKHDRNSPEEEEEKEEIFPDIEEDDVVYRKEKTSHDQRPLSGAPDNYNPMPIPEPWTLPPELKAKLLCPPCPLTQEVERDKANKLEKEMRPDTDDMLVRKLEVCNRVPLTNQKGPPVPSTCSEEDLQKWQTIRKASQLKHRKKLLVERLAALKT